LVRELNYPVHSEIVSTIKSASPNAFLLPASKVAVELGDVRMTNVIMIGALLGFKKVPLSLELIEYSIKNNLKPKLVEINLKALEAGRNLIKEMV